jgi:hypothetical protein
MALNAYITECRQLLHDVNVSFWSNDELTSYINDGRRRIAVDTHCLRFLQSQNLSAGTETYSVSALPLGSTTFDVLNITVLWGSSRIPLRYLPFTQFNAALRTWTALQGRPVAWTLYGQSAGTVYVGPIPDQTYVSEWDTAALPADLVDDTTPEPLVYPFTSPVAFYAAYKAKFKEQSFGESDVFHDQYTKKMMEAINSFTRRLPDVYAV